MNKRRILHIIILAGCIILGAGVVSGNAEAAKKPKLNKTSVTLVKNKKYSLKLKNISKKQIKKVTYKSSKKAVAKVTSKGRITAKKAGTATVTCKVVLKNKKQYVLKCRVKVTKVKKLPSDGKKQVTVERNYDPDEDEHEESSKDDFGKKVLKYNYSMKVLNKMNLYSGHTIVVYIETENPCQNDEEFYFLSDGDFSYVQTYDYSDITYVEDYPVLLYGKKKCRTKDGKSGYILTIEFDKSGQYDLYLVEENNTGKVQGASLSLEIKDFKTAEKEWGESVLEYLSSNEYSNKDAFGDWETMSAVDKFERIKCHIRNTFKYDYNNSNGLVDLVANEGAYWERGHIDCWDSTHIMRLFATMLGYESEDTYAGYLWHYYATIFIDGKGYVYDACPYSESGYIETWDDIL